MHGCEEFPQHIVGTINICNWFHKACAVLTAKTPVIGVCLWRASVRPCPYDLPHRCLGIVSESALAACQSVCCRWHRHIIGQLDCLRVCVHMAVAILATYLQRLATFAQVTHCYGLEAVWLVTCHASNADTSRGNDTMRFHTAALLASIELVQLKCRV